MLPNANSIQVYPAGKVIDKHAVAVSFSRAADSYDRVANIQRWVVAELLARGQAMGSAQQVLDIGCGTGFLTQKVIKQLNPKTVIGIDIAEGMAKSTHTKLQQVATVKLKASVCGDAEALPFKAGSFDLLVSSFALQWCPDLTRTFAEIHRVLAPGARAYFALPIGQTLHELKTCWRQVDPDTSHVNEFYQQQELVAAAQQLDFKQVNIEVQEQQEFYPDLRAITNALKAMGAHNVTQGRAKQLTGKQKLKQLTEQYERYRSDRGLPVTWQVAFGSLLK